MKTGYTEVISFGFSRAYRVFHGCLHAAGFAAIVMANLPLAYSTMAFVILGAAGSLNVLHLCRLRRVGAIRFSDTGVALIQEKEKRDITLYRNALLHTHFVVLHYREVGKHAWCLPETLVVVGDAIDSDSLRRLRLATKRAVLEGPSSR